MTGEGRRDDSELMMEKYRSYLFKELDAARDAVDLLEATVQASHAMKEQSSEMVFQAHRALSRIEKAVPECGADLIGLAVEIKLAAKEGVRLVEAYGEKSVLPKFLAAPFKRKAIPKMAKVAECLTRLLLPEDRTPPPLSPVLVPSGPSLSSPSISQSIHHADVLDAPYTEIRNGKHDTVTSLCFAPATGPGRLPSGQHRSLWWATGNLVEYYSEIAECSTTFPMDQGSYQVTAMAVDSCGTIWTGHQKGEVRVRRRKTWDHVVECHTSSATITCICFEKPGLAWVGDAAGNIQVLSLAGDGQVLQHLDTVNIAPPTVTSEGGMEVPRSPRRGGRNKCHRANKPLDQAVRCMYIRSGKAWVAVGKSECYLALINCADRHQVDIFNCTEPYGPCNAMAELPCVDDLSHPSPGTPGEMSLVRSQEWRLLTGHKNGQVLMWHPDYQTLQPMLKFGDLSSSVKGICVFPNHRILVVGRKNGELHVSRANLENMEMSTPKDAKHLSTIRPKKVVVPAHKSNLALMVGGGFKLATASAQGTIRLWQAEELEKEAEKGHVLPALGSKTKSSTSTELDSLHSRNNSRAPSGTLDVHFHIDSFTPGGSSPSTPTGTGHTNSLRESTSSAALAHLQRSSHLRSLSGGDALEICGSRSRQGSDDGSQKDLSRKSWRSDRLDSLSQGGAQVVNPGTQIIEASELQMDRLIGQGAYGKVWLAQWCGSQVAAKELLAIPTVAPGDEDDYEALKQYEEERKALIHEVHLLGSMSHPNVMRFCAVCFNPPIIVTQYYPHGSLFDLLKKGRRGDKRATSELTWIRRIHMLRDVASGMQFLHTRKPPVIHGDLRSPNLLLEMGFFERKDRPRYHVKIADFGLARFMESQMSSVAVSRSTNPRWSAPEVIRDSKVSKAADVYSFAIIMWELLTWQQPFEDMMSIQVIYSAVHDNSRPVVPADGDLPGEPGPSLGLYKQVMEQCWDGNAAKRPSFDKLVTLIDQMAAMEPDSHKKPVRPPELIIRDPPPRSRLSETGLDSLNSSGSREASSGTVAVQASGSCATPFASESLQSVPRPVQSPLPQSGTAFAAAPSGVSPFAAAQVGRPATPTSSNSSSIPHNLHPGASPFAPLAGATESPFASPFYEQATHHMAEDSNRLKVVPAHLGLGPEQGAQHHQHTGSGGLRDLEAVGPHGPGGLPSSRESSAQDESCFEYIEDDGIAWQGHPNMVRRSRLARVSYHDEVGAAFPLRHRNLSARQLSANERRGSNDPGESLGDINSFSLPPRYRVRRTSSGSHHGGSGPSSPRSNVAPVNGHVHPQRSTSDSDLGVSMVPTYSSCQSPFLNWQPPTGPHFPLVGVSVPPSRSATPLMDHENHVSSAPGSGSRSRHHSQESPGPLQWSPPNSPRSFSGEGDNPRTTLSLRSKSEVSLRQAVSQGTLTPPTGVLARLDWEASPSEAASTPRLPPNGLAQMEQQQEEQQDMGYRSISPFSIGSSPDPAEHTNGNSLLPLSPSQPPPGMFAPMILPSRASTSQDPISQTRSFDGAISGFQWVPVSRGTSAEELLQDDRNWLGLQRSITATRSLSTRDRPAAEAGDRPSTSQGFYRSVQRDDSPPQPNSTDWNVTVADWREPPRLQLEPDAAPPTPAPALPPPPPPLIRVGQQDESESEGPSTPTEQRNAEFGVFEAPGTPCVADERMGLASMASMIFTECDTPLRTPSATALFSPGWGIGTLTPARTATTLLTPRNREHLGNTPFEQLPPNVRADSLLLRLTPTQPDIPRPARSPPSPVEAARQEGSHGAVSSPAEVPRQEGSHSQRG